MEAFILAGGKGTRMKSRTPKPLIEVGGYPLVLHIIKKLELSGIKKITVVTGHKGDLVERAVSTKNKSVKFVRQDKLDGTGGAIRDTLSKSKNVGKTFVVMNSDDSLFYDPKEIKEIISEHTKSKSLASLFITKENLNRSYRKVFLDKDGNFDRFTKRKSKRGYTVTGFYVFDRTFISQALKKINPIKGELGLPDFMYLPGIAKRIHCKIIKPENWFGINTREELKLARKIWK